MYPRLAISAPRSSERPKLGHDCIQRAAHLSDRDTPKIEAQLELCWPHRLIQKTEEVVERDLSLQEKERLYNELKAILARQPGPEVAEQLSVYQSSLRGKTRQMKSMASELNMYQAQLSEYKYEVERLTRELQDAKRKYYESKRRDQLARELDAEERDLGALQAQTQLAASQSAKTRFTGGGSAIR